MRPNHPLLVTGAVTRHHPAVQMLLLVLVGAASAAIPLPTPEQLAWQQGEIMALIHFNMATFSSEYGCNAANWVKGEHGGGPTSNPRSFAPTALDPSNWAESMLALGVRESVLTAKQ